MVLFIVHRLVAITFDSGEENLVRHGEALTLESTDNFHNAKIRKEGFSTCL